MAVQALQSLVPIFPVSHRETSRHGTFHCCHVFDLQLLELQHRAEMIRAAVAELPLNRLGPSQ